MFAAEGALEKGQAGGIEEAFEERVAAELVALADDLGFEAAEFFPGVGKAAGVEVDVRAGNGDEDGATAMEPAHEVEVGGKAVTLLVVEAEAVVRGAFEEPGLVAGFELCHEGGGVEFVVVPDVLAVLQMPVARGRVVERATGLGGDFFGDALADVGRVPVAGVEHVDEAAAREAHAFVHGVVNAGVGFGDPAEAAVEARFEFAQQGGGGIGGGAVDDEVFELSGGEGLREDALRGFAERVAGVAAHRDDGDERFAGWGGGVHEIDTLPHSIKKIIHGASRRLFISGGHSRVRARRFAWVRAGPPAWCQCTSWLMPVAGVVMCHGSTVRRSRK